VADFDGKVAVVTGGSLGIGRAAVEKLAGEGASVVLCSDREDSVEEAVERLRARKLEVRGLCADVTTSEYMRRLVSFAVEAYGGVTCW
jgi:NAD(P)-dependent dehydrogenase (short-subunit alcohol dehydrogenase family)